MPKRSTRPVPLYRDGRHYDLTTPVTEDIPFYLSQAKRCNGPVLEVCCGTGRVTLPLKKSGIDIEGLDLSRSMLQHAQTKALDEGLSLRWICADCRSFEIPKRFSLIIMPYNSFQFLLDRSSQESFLASVKKHLKRDGLFVFDIFNPYARKLSSKGKRYPRCRYTDPDGRGMITLERVDEYDEARQLMKLTGYYSLPRRKDFTRVEFYQRYLYPKELDTLLFYNGFVVTEKFGSFDGQNFETGMSKQIVICKPMVKVQTKKKRKHTH